MENIGKYRIEEKIGVGGFGAVYRGYDPLIKRHVAVKTCNSDEEEITSRFFQEAEIAGNLHHRNITTVYDFGVHEGLPFLIQEYLSGEDLDVKIRRREYLPFPEKLFYLLQVARGLAHAHAEGVVHRDIKPSNVRILEDGTAKIMDFGIAKLALQESGLTKTGMTVGTATYLAPEQVRGEAVDQRADVFSFGCLAYELLTYERPFQGEQISTVLYHLLNSQPKPITDLWPAAPPEVVAIVDRCLEKTAGERFADGAELVRVLETLQRRGGDAPPRDASPPRDARAGAASPETAPEPTLRLDGVSVAARAADRARVFTPASLAVLLLLAAAAALAGWWYGLRDEAAAHGAAAAATLGRSEAPPSAAALDRPAPSEPAGQAVPAVDEPAAEPPAADQGEVPDETGETDEIEPDETGETGETGETDETGETAPVAAEPPPPPPPAPTTGRLVLPAVDWTDAMTVRIDGRTHGLGPRQTLELPPGRYPAQLELSTPDYSPASREVDVRIVAGGSVELEVAIPPPGALSVRPFPGRPQGRILIDGEPVGETPLSGIRREPGVYVIGILPRDGEGPGLEERAVLEAGREVILSFDLEAGRIVSRDRPL